MNVAGKPQEGQSAQAIDFDRFRLRRFIDELAGAREFVDETAQPESVEIDGLRGPALLRLTGNVHGVSSQREL